MLRGYSLKNRISIFLLMLISTLLIGAIGYAYIKTNIEGGSATVLDSVYWAAVTISTIGYSNNGIYLTSAAGKAFSIFVIALGIFVIFVGVQIGVGPWFEHKLEHMMEKRRAPIPKEGHVIVAGISELGEESVNELLRRKIPVAAIDDDEARLRPLLERNIPIVLGDPTRESVLKSANIKEARAIITASDDTTNAFVAITARHIKPDIRVASSASRRSSLKVLRHSGVNSVARSKWISGERLAAKAIGEEAAGRELEKGTYLYQVEVKRSSKMGGMSMGDAVKKFGGIAIVGVRRKGEFHPYKQEMKLMEGDVIHLIGGREAFHKAKEAV